MFSFTLSEQFLTTREQAVFTDFLSYHHLDDNIWQVFATLFKTPVKHTRPFVLRVHDDGRLCGAAILLKCTKYGKALFRNELLANFTNALAIPCFIWIKFGCGMDMMSNPGFAADPARQHDVNTAMIDYLNRHTLLTIVNDYTDHAAQYGKAPALPALPHALIHTGSMQSVNDYLGNFKNIKKKLKRFRKKGGEYTCIGEVLNDPQIAGLEHCFRETAGKSVFYLPYQDLYLNSAVRTARTRIRNVHYFIALMDGEFLGYQAAIQSGSHLNALHGAFDRTRKTTYHAYDILFVKMTEFALEHNLQSIDFGAVLNHTKQRMVNTTAPMSYFLLSKYSVVRQLFRVFLKITKIQGRQQLQFRKGH